MKDQALMATLLQRMSDDVAGTLLTSQKVPMSGQDKKEFHQVELLCDMGLAVERGEGVYRITAAGYSFLEEQKAGA